MTIEMLEPGTGHQLRQMGLYVVGCLLFLLLLLLSLLLLLLLLAGELGLASSRFALIHSALRMTAKAAKDRW